jgi:hypothetical protein
MQKDDFLPAAKFLLICAFLIPLFLTLPGCATTNIKMPKPLPPIVKEYKHVTVLGGHIGMHNTWVYLESGDAYSILATGRIYYQFRHGEAQERPLLTRIGEDYVANRFGLLNGISLTTDQSGYLYLGYKSDRMTVTGDPYPTFEQIFPRPNYREDKGQFSVDIIVYNETDWIKIYDFLSQLTLKDPDNIALADAHRDAKRYASIARAQKKASEEIEKTEQQISELKKEDGQPGVQPLPEELQPAEVFAKSAEKAAEAFAKEDKIGQLQARLAKLLESQAQLEEMKKELKEERKKSSLLAEELGEKERREQELLTQLAQGAKNPPLIMIASPKDGDKLESNSTALAGVAEDEQGIERLEIFINGQPLEEKTGRGLRLQEKGPSRRIEFNEPIPLQPGENQIRVRAVDSDGFASEKTLVVKNVELRKNIWAVVVGINDYPNTRRLKWAVNDARAFYRHLVDVIQVPDENVTLLLNADASLARMRSTLGTQLKKMAGKQDMVIIYFAGHGATEKDVLSPDGDGLEKYILPYDVDPEDLYASALPMREISHIFYRIQSQRIIFIADACYSGASGGRTISLSGIRANISDAFLDRITTGKGTIIMTASGANEVSAEDEKLQHGVFTFYLLEGLAGAADADKDGLITVDEIYHYVSVKVPRATGQEQHPVKKGTVEGRLILSIIR